MLNSLFSPFEINGKKLKNRSVVPAMVMNFCNEDGTCTDRFAAYHEAKAKGGFGMIITEDFAVSPYGKGFQYLPGLWSDDQVPGFRAFTERIHKYGTVLIAQIYHAGRQTHEDIIGTAPWAPSAIPCPFSPESIPHEMTIDEIKHVVSQYGDCARRAEEAGFDGIEIHGAHGYLIAQFMSSYSNKRTDMYGGSLQNRMRFALEIIKDIRSKVSDSFIVGYRISADEYVMGGQTIEDTKTIVPYLDEAGINYVHVSVGVYRSFDAVIPSMYTRHAWIADYAKEVKEVTDLPVISVGRYNDPRLANTIVKTGKADLVSFGRQSLADPETINKAKEGRFDDIRTCIGCHHGCIGNLLANTPGECILNPTLGHEYEHYIKKTDSPKNVMVIGAGPGGLSAAIYAAEVGHKVTVYDKRHWAGGQFRLGGVPSGKGEIINFINWQMHTLAKLGVEVKLKTEVTVELVKEICPDVVVAATGAEPVLPPIPGVDNANVVTSHDVLEGKANTGAQIVVIGGGCVGAETANHLASNLKDVTVIEMLPDIATDEVIVPRWGLLDDMKKNNVKIMTNTTVKEIRENSVVISGETEKEITCDTVVLSVGSRSVKGLAEQLKECGFDVRIIGDAAKVGLANKAIKEGYLLANEI